jgi:ATP-dependent DNA helicase Q1
VVTGRLFIWFRPGEETIARDQHTLVSNREREMARHAFGSSDHIRVHEVEVVAGSSSSHNPGRKERFQRPGGSSNSTDSDRGKQIISRIAQLETEVEGYRVDMIEIQKRMESRLQEKEMLERQLAQPVHRVDAKGKGKAKEGINYMTEPFDWSEGLKARMKAVFGIQSFRLCQEG